MRTALPAAVHRCAALMLCTLALAGCDMPKDPEGTTERILASHSLRVGVTENPPWIVFQGDRVTGTEAQLIERFAATLHARVAWTKGSESNVLSRLKERKLDIVVGGFRADSPWADTLGTSRPYLHDHLVFTAPGENQLLLRLDRFLVYRSGKAP